MVTGETERKYECPKSDGIPRCGDILSEVVALHISLDSIESSNPDVVLERHPFAIVLSQDCDLEQQFDQLNKGEVDRLSLPNTLFCEAVELGKLRSALPPGSDIWKRVKQNKDERYQCLEQVAAEFDSRGDGVPELGIDFKRVFTVPTDELRERLRRGTVIRRASLLPIYARHFLGRFISYHSRVGLPQDHLIT